MPSVRQIPFGHGIRPRRCCSVGGARATLDDLVALSLLTAVDSPLPQYEVPGCLLPLLRPLAESQDRPAELQPRRHVGDQLSAGVQRLDVGPAAQPALVAALVGGGVASTGAVFFCAIASGQDEVSTRQKQSAETIKLVDFLGNISR